LGVRKGKSLPWWLPKGKRHQDEKVVEKGREGSSQVGGDQKEERKLWVMRQELM